MQRDDHPHVRRSSSLYFPKPTIRNSEACLKLKRPLYLHPAIGRALPNIRVREDERLLGLDRIGVGPRDLLRRALRRVAQELTYSSETHATALSMSSRNLIVVVPTTPSI